MKNNNTDQQIICYVELLNYWDVSGVLLIAEFGNRLEISASLAVFFSDSQLIFNVLHMRYFFHAICNLTQL